MSDVVGRTAAQPRVVYRGRRIRNAPDAATLEITDDRWTPQSFIDSLGVSFTLDVAASARNAKARTFYTIEQNGLVQPWTGRVWCNPPYSDIAPWVAKAHQAMGHRHGPELVAMLLPATRTDQAWWHDYVEPYRDRGLGLRVEFIRRRLRFESGAGPIMPEPGSMGGKKNPKSAQPPFGNVLLWFTRPWRVVLPKVTP